MGRRHALQSPKLNPNDIGKCTEEREDTCKPPFSTHYIINFLVSVLLVLPPCKLCSHFGFEPDHAFAGNTMLKHGMYSVVCLQHELPELSRMSIAELEHMLQRIFLLLPKFCFFLIDEVRSWPRSKATMYASIIICDATSIPCIMRSLHCVLVSNS